MTVQLDSVQGPAAGMAAREGDVGRRMPVLGRSEVLEPAGPNQGAHRLDQEISLRYRECAARHEIGLHVHHQQRAAIAVERDAVRDHRILPSTLRPRRSVGPVVSRSEDSSGLAMKVERTAGRAPAADRG